MDAERFYEELARRAGLPRGEAERVAHVCLQALHLRMHEAAARRVEGLLPADLRALWAHGGEALKEERDGVSDFTRSQFIHFVADRLGGSDDREAERLIRATFGALRAHAPGSDALVREEVPEGIRELWTGPAGQAAR